MSLSQLKAVPEQRPVEPIDKLIRAQFSVAAEVAVHKPVDLEAIGHKALPGIPNALRTEFHFDDSHRPDGEQQFTMEFIEGDEYFGAITARMNVSNGKIRLFDMQYDARKIRGFAPYALRHLIAVFRDVKDLVVSTGVMADLSKLDKVDAEDRLKVIVCEHAKLKNFDAIGFPLIDARTGRRIELPSVDNLKPCRAVLSFDDEADMDAVSRNLEAKTTPQPKHDVVVTEPIRQDNMPSNGYAAVIPLNR